MNTTIKKRIEEINSGRVPEGYEKTSFGIFPCDWEKSCLGDLFNFSGGLGKSREELGDKGACYLHYGDMHVGDFNKVSYSQYLEKPKYNTKITGNETFLMKDGDIAFLDASEDLEGTSRAVLIDNPQNEPFIAGLHTILAKEKVVKLSKFYKQYITIPNSVKKQFQKLVSGFKVYGINRDTIKKIEIVYPKSSQEQSRIAEILMQWDKAIELQEKLIKSYQNLKKYYLSKMFPKKGSLYPEIRFAGFTEPWEVRKLGELCKITSGFMGDSQLTNGKFRLTKIETISDGFVDESRVGYSDVKPSINYLLKPGDILYSNINSLSHMGKVAKYQGKSELYHGINLLRLSPNELIKSEFLFQMLNTERKRNWAKSHANKAVNQASINQTLLASQEVFVCGLYEQKLIGNYFANFDNYILFCLNILDKLIKQRKALQQYLLTGIVRV